MKETSKPTTEQNKPTGKSAVREIIEFIILVIVIVLPFRIFIAEPYIVSGASMSQTFETGHYLIVNKFWHKIHGAERGDVLVFTSPTEEDKSYIKRVIALPGETIKIENRIVSIKKPGSDVFRELTEDYIKNPTFSRLEITLKEDQYFMMGDNRANSFDSRQWGPLDASYIKGEPFLRLFPFNQVSTMPGTSQDIIE